MKKNELENAHIWALSGTSRLLVKTWDKGQLAVKAEEIVCVVQHENTGGCTVLVKKEASEMEISYDFEASIADFEKFLPPNIFSHIQSNKLLNLAMVDRIMNHSLYVGKHQFTMSKKHYDEVLSHFVIDGLNDQAIQIDKLAVPDSIFVWEKKQYVKIEYRHIQWIRAEGNYTYISQDNQERIICTVCSLAKWKVRLPSPPFQIVHRSYLVNLNLVTGFGNNKLYLMNHEIPIPKGKVKETKEFFTFMKRENKK